MFGKRLRLARQRAGLSMRLLAEQMDPMITPQAISKYELGKMMPSSSVLVGLGKALNVSLDFLMSTQVEEIDGLEFRKHTGSKARDRAKAEAALIDHLERYLSVEEILGLAPKGDPFGGHRYESVATEEEIDGWADALRNAWGLGLGPVPSLCAVLEENGIKVIEVDLPEGITGLACRALRGGKPIADAVVLSSRSSVERKRFTLAHELAHRIIRSTANPAIGLETAMNRFAGSFLVPARHLSEQVGETRLGTTYFEIIRLKHFYGVSAAAMLGRLGQVGILRPAVIKRAFQTFARSWRRVEPEPMRENQGLGAIEVPQRFERLVWRAVGDHLISPVRAAGLLNESLDTAERQISGPATN
ncbi:MAG: XRE family transcriptional regulator [Bryobacterales bacterium]|nr:XRE family transcriptional regulator [Bryobacterales bacterium]